MRIFRATGGLYVDHGRAIRHEWRNHKRATPPPRTDLGAFPQACF
ncbi:MAG: hypothetical protein QOE06_568, partial [Thermoleophilaceae bacterium]|nr:hypothetical protein [Thermoleophilaceae bacterium]